MKELPRRAPGTPKQSTPDLPPMPDMSDILDELGYDFTLAQLGTPPHIGSTNISLQDKLRRAEAVTREATPDLSPMGRKAFEYDAPRSVVLSAEGTPLSDTNTRNRDAGATTFDTPPLTSRAASDAIKPKRFVNLLPKQQRINLGLQTQPLTGLRQKKSATIRAPLGDRTNAPVRLGAITPHSIASVLAKVDETSHHPLTKAYAPPSGTKPDDLKKPARANAPRPTTRPDPLGSSTRLNTPPSKPSPQLPYFTGGGNGGDTPSLDMGSTGPSGYFDDPFPSSHSYTYTHPYAETSDANNAKGRRHQASSPVFDFTASPDISFSSDTSVSMPSFPRRGSIASLDSDLPTEEWELEAYLRELDRVDHERTAAGGAEVGVGR